MVVQSLKKTPIHTGIGQLPGTILVIWTDDTGSHRMVKKKRTGVCTGDRGSKSVTEGSSPEIRHP